MLNDNIKSLILATVSLYDVEILSQEIINEGLENLNKAIGLSVDGVKTWLQTLLSTSGAESVT